MDSGLWGAAERVAYTRRCVSKTKGIHYSGHYTDPTGAVRTAGTFSSDRRARKAATAIQGTGFEPRRVHDIRASHISWLLGAGVALPDVMERVGIGNSPPPGELAGAEHQ